MDLISPLHRETVHAFCIIRNVYHIKYSILLYSVLFYPLSLPPSLPFFLYRTCAGSHTNLNQHRIGLIRSILPIQNPPS